MALGGIDGTALVLRRLAARGFPIVALTGPRQSGKTTLARASFPDKPYVSLENPDEREFAEQDPRRFLERFNEGAILDEVQRCPPLFPGCKVSSTNDSAWGIFS